MRRFARVPLGILILLAAPATFPAAEPDPIRVRLDESKKEYENATLVYRQAVRDHLAQREEAARKGGDKKVVDAVKADAEAFDERGEQPPSIPPALRRKPAAARAAWAAALAAGVKDYTRAKQDDAAAAVQRDVNAFATDCRREVERENLSLLKGEWVLQTRAVGGTPEKGANGSMTVEIDGTSYHQMPKKGLDQHGVLSINSDATPKEYDLTMTYRAADGKVVQVVTTKGVFEVTVDALTLHATKGKPGVRPTALTPRDKDRANAIVWVFRRK